MANSRMQVEVGFGRLSSGTTRREGRPRMLVVADLCGRSRQPLARRRAWTLDLDNLEQVFESIGPRLSIDLEGQALDIAFESPEDFHPDRLFERLPVFESLRTLRDELADPQRFRRAAAALSLGAGPGSPTPADDRAPDFERLLGRGSAIGEGTPARAAQATTAAGLMDSWIRELVAPHVVPNTTNEQRALTSAADDAIAALMRRVLHHPRFQALEAAWLGIERLVRGLDLDQGLTLVLLDAGRDEIEHDIASHRDDLTASAMHHHLCGPADASPDGARWTLWALDAAFGPSADDVQLLASLGAISARAGAPLLAAATPQAAGCGTRDGLAQPRQWLPAEAPELAPWQALRTAPMARWIGLALPRVLMRLPYGARGEVISRFAFEELTSASDHEDFLWGGAGLALALLAGRALQDEEGEVAEQLDLDDLPSAIVTHDGERHQQPCAELLLAESAGQALLQRGLMPLMSWRDRNAARLMRWQSVADPVQAIAGL